MLLLLSSGPALSTLAIVLTAAGGLVGAFIALLNLRGETNQSAVSQAQGANETMVELNRILKDSLDRANARGDLYREQLHALQERYDALEDTHDRMVARWGPFPNGEHTAA